MRDAHLALHDRQRRRSRTRRTEKWLIKIFSKSHLFYTGRSRLLQHTRDLALLLRIEISDEQRSDALHLLLGRCNLVISQIKPRSEAHRALLTHPRRIRHSMLSEQREELATDTLPHNGPLVVGLV